MKKLLVSVLLPAAMLAGGAGRLPATGYFGPTEYLARGGRNIVLAPEFYWELEVKRLAGAYRPTEKFLFSSRDSWGFESEARRTALRELTASADTADFKATLAAGAIKPSDPVQAAAQHEAARVAILGKPEGAILPAEFDSEFADYHRGALAFRQGPAQWDEARRAWEKLLQRPALERRYRSVWAAFMLGKLALKRGEPEAVRHFQAARELARAGCVDSLGLAADSYGWEARSEWKEGHPEKAAPLYLTQLALGDESAVHSLKALIPDREPVDGMLNYDPVADEATLANPTARTALADRQLRAAAADPLLRRLVTVHILATESNRALSGDAANAGQSRAARWLRILQEAKPKVLEDAEYLGWVAYSAGSYRDAEAWLKLPDAKEPARCWLRAKLERRAGRAAEALASMAEAFRTLRSESAYTRWSPAPGAPAPEQGWNTSGENWSFPSAAAGQLGALSLERSEFTAALRAFLEGGLWSDAAFVAERVLTVDELKTFVDQEPPIAALGKGGPLEERSLRYLLGRRLVREDRYEEAAAYLKAPFASVLQRYVQALKEAGDEKLAKPARARAWFRAGWIARFQGMELMGSEAAPDGFETGGAFPNADVAKERLTGRYSENGGSGEPGKAPALLIAATPTKAEKERLQRNRINPDVRFHYRVVAAALAMRAAALLPDGAEELGDVINQAGNWVKGRDEKLADRYLQTLKARAPQTMVGAAAMKKRWFVDDPGPWSRAEKASEPPAPKDPAPGN